jgi:hypothetical protein
MCPQYRPLARFEKHGSCLASLLSLLKRRGNYFSGPEREEFGFVVLYYFKSRQELVRSISIGVVV